MSKHKREKIHRANPSSNFLGASFSNREILLGMLFVPLDLLEYRWLISDSMSSGVVEDTTYKEKPKF